MQAFSEVGLKIILIVFTFAIFLMCFRALLVKRQKWIAWPITIFFIATNVVVWIIYTGDPDKAQTISRYLLLGVLVTAATLALVRRRQQK